MHHPDQLITLFNACFEQSHQTILLYGEDEPVYYPADQEHPYHRILFAHGFFSSALHECAHWFLAGQARRKLLDYGYWYVPDGRSPAEQALFQAVEVKPQAIEWLLSKAANFKFHFSSDNVGTSDLDETQTLLFQEAVRRQVLIYEQKGLPPRAARFYDALLGYYSRFKCAEPAFGDGMGCERIVGQ